MVGMTQIEDHKKLTFRDRQTKISRILIVTSTLIFLSAVVLLTIATSRSLERQTEMTKLIGLAEAQGGDMTVARQLFDTMQKVGKLTKLPTDETPVFATIGDISKLKTQPAFKEAINGDLILLYQKSQWVYIYRPSINKIVSQGPFALPQPEAQSQQAPPPPQPQTKIEVPTEVPIPSPSPEAASNEAEVQQ